MEKQELLLKMNKVKNNLLNVRRQLVEAQKVLNQSISFNNVGFKSTDISKLNQKIELQINSLDKRIIPEIKKM